MAAPLPSPPGSPGLGGVPLQRVGPSGPDPFAEQRAQLREEARAGALCPTNQHGCMYFSASEWRFCPFCEWSTGHAQGEVAGLLARMGGPLAEHQQQQAAGAVVYVSRENLNTIFAEPSTCSFSGPLSDSWFNEFNPLDGNVRLTRAQLHNLLMLYGAPIGCLTDEHWLTLQATYPPPAPAGDGAAEQV
jgi:hypothetical protein